MQLGIHLPHIGRKASPAAIRRAALEAEALGFHDVWVSEHIIVPKDGGYPPLAELLGPCPDPDLGRRRHQQGPAWHLGPGAAAAPPAAAG